MYRLNLVLVLAALLCACGFHLRGHEKATSSTASSIYLQSSSAPSVAAEVASILKIGGAAMAASPAEADYILTISNESFNREVLSVSAETGKVREYQLTLIASLSVSRGPEDALVNNEPVTYTRDYTFDDTSILGKSNEELVLREDLVRQVSMQIVRRFNAVAK